MNLVLIVRFIHGMVTGALAMLLIGKVSQTRVLRYQKKLMYDALESISSGKRYNYDPDASIPDDYDGLMEFCLAARSTNRRLSSDANMALNEIDRMDGRDNEAPY